MKPRRTVIAVGGGMMVLAAASLLDMARVPAEVNRLSNQVLVQTFEDEWGKVQR